MSPLRARALSSLFKTMVRSGQMPPDGVGRRFPQPLRARFALRINDEIGKVGAHPFSAAIIRPVEQRETPIYSEERGRPAAGICATLANW